MYTTDLPATDLPIPEADLTPDERRREIAAILAAGILRLRTRREAMPGLAACATESGPEKLPHSAEK